MCKRRPEQRRNPIKLEKHALALFSRNAFQQRAQRVQRVFSQVVLVGKKSVAQNTAYCCIRGRSTAAQSRLYAKCSG